MTIQKIIHVYQLQYLNGKPTGFGDYLRGTLFLLQICEKYNLEFDIDINAHPISFFLNKEKLNNYDNIIKRNEISKFENPIYLDLNNNPININSNHFISKISKMTTSQTVFLYCNEYPYPNMNPKIIEIIKDKIQPNDEMQTYIDENLKLLNLVKNNYGVIHIRCGDEYLTTNKKLDITYSKKIIKSFTNHIKKDNTKYLILSDCAQIKYLFRSFSNCVFSVKNITHLSLGNITLENVKNTMIDFYLMSHSNQIFNISSLCHGSSFSQMCGIIYSIPYSKEIITNFKIKMTL
jgi:hypothetical protein